MIFGAEKIEKENFEGPSQGKISRSKTILPEKGLPEEKRGFRREKTISDIFSPPQIINGQPLKNAQFH